METHTFVLFGEGLPDVTILRAEQPRGVQWGRDIAPAINRLARRLSTVKRHEPGCWYFIEGYMGNWEGTKFPRYILVGKNFIPYEEGNNVHQKKPSV